MAFSGRAWAVANSKSPSNIARMVANMASNGGNGVLAPGHLQVVATPTPSGSVRIMPGTAVMNSRYPGSSFETYVDRNDQAFDWPITPTGSGGGRTDYLVVRVEDPQFPGQAAPADLIKGPYTKMQALTTDPRVAPPAFPFVLLAVITIPPSTATITQAMIASGPSVRELANPRIHHYDTAYNGQATGSIFGNPLRATTMDTWLATALGTVEVPLWATNVSMRILLLNLFAQSNDLWGQVTIRLVTGSTFIDAPYGHFDLSTTKSDPGNQRFSTGAATAAGTIVPPAMRGQTAMIQLRGFRQGGDLSTTGVYLGTGAVAMFDATFYQSAIEEMV